jgi:phage shock protein C
MLYGVAAGMAKYLNIDPTIIRLAWVVVVLLPGPNLIVLVAYLILCLVIPEEAPAPPAAPPTGPPTYSAPPATPPAPPAPADGGREPARSSDPTSQD